MSESGDSGVAYSTHPGVPPLVLLVRHHWTMAEPGRDGVLAVQAERVLAEIERLQQELDAGDLVVLGSKGQPTPNKLLGELRSHRWLLARLLADGPASGPPVADAVDALRREWEDSGVS
jgi:hypothetical protein